MYKYLSVILVLLVFASSCKKDQLNWEVVESVFIVDMSLELAHSDDFNVDNPYDTIPNDFFRIFDEKHQYAEGQQVFNPYKKEFILEISNTSSDFRYENEEIYKNLDCAVWHRISSNTDGYYRIHKGFVEGKKVNGEWVIDFSVSYGGRKDDRFQMVKGAN